MSEIYRLNARLPDGLADWLKKTASEERCSVNEQAIACLIWLKDQKEVFVSVKKKAINPIEYSDSIPIITLRLPEYLVSWLKEQAIQNHRSMNNQLVESLEIAQMMMGNQEKEAQKSKEPAISFASIDESGARQVALQFFNKLDGSTIDLDLSYDINQMAHALHATRFIQYMYNGADGMNMTNALEFDGRTATGDPVNLSWKAQLDAYGDLTISESTGQYTAQVRDKELSSIDITADQLQDMFGRALNAVEDFTEKYLVDEGISSAISEVQGLVSEISEDSFQTEDQYSASRNNARPKP